MKVFMLGWEYPPNIGGGLGTACQGLTTSLARLGVKIDFIVPRLSGRERAPHMNLIDSYTGLVTETDVLEKAKASVSDQNINVISIPALLSPYVRPESYEKWIEYYKSGGKDAVPAEVASIIDDALIGEPEPISENLYGKDLFAEVDRYTRNVIAIAQKRDFDLVHAHDWMTYPAGIAVAMMSGKPLCVHVHSLEFDRSGEGVNERINQIERSGIRTAETPIAVSYYTRSVINSQHSVPLEKIEVVHNGVYTKEVRKSYEQQMQIGRTKMVLFMGRITFQKGPEYFVEAAAKVIPLVPDVVFVMAGSGDMLPQLKLKVQSMGLESYFMFPGFLKGQEVEKMYSMADVYVMPSVSEPFGIAPLEAMSHDVPTIISKQSGVAEVLNNALKVDYWDVDRLAHLIVGVLRYPEVRQDIVSMGRDEVKKIHWDAAARKTIEIYTKTLTQFVGRNR